MIQARTENFSVSLAGEQIKSDHTTIMDVEVQFQDELADRAGSSLIFLRR